jgi:hypothetical protein
MVTDLVTHHLERGVDRDEVAQLLGREDYREAKRRRLVWVYKANDSFLLPGCGYLTIRFGQGDRVTGWEQYVDG